MADLTVGGYYAVIPAQVRYDQELKPNAKLLYGELTALCGKSGYCWATNEYFADLYGLSVGTISRLIAQLEERGYIRMEMAANAKGAERRIYAGVFLAHGEGSCQKEQEPLDEKRKRGLDEKSNPHNRYNNTQEYDTEHTPHTPQEGGGASQGKRRKPGPKAAPDWKPERFAAFWAAYPLGKAKQAAIRAWDKLRPDDALLEEMARGLKRAMVSSQWREGIGVPYASTWLNNRRWEDEDRDIASTTSAPKSRKYHTEIWDGEEVTVFDE